MRSVGVEEQAGRFPGALSGGQQQRVAVARGIVGAPPIVLADEPTANLDSATGLSLVALLKELNRAQGTTFVFSAHDPRIIGRADRVITLLDGRVTEDRRRAARRRDALGDRLGKSRPGGDSVTRDGCRGVPRRDAP